ncbi:MAG: hypothetical protein JO153_10630 [Solirubrobacterales bacterium]|nr:hypothetical protein [Solirubrobacterales bacterium]MBV9916944.1 hypothetical protein [Solirubrobacterales bacterium]
MSRKQFVLTYCAARIGYAVGLIVAPTRVARPWLGDMSRASSQIATRGLGVRELALCVGALAASASEAPARWWLAACAASDSVDLASTLLADDRDLPSHAKVGTVLAAGSFGAVAAALALAERSGARPLVHD